MIDAVPVHPGAPVGSIGELGEIGRVGSPPGNCMRIPLASRSSLTPGNFDAFAS